MGSARIAFSLIVLGGLGSTLAATAPAQQPAAQSPASASRLVGSITAIDGRTLTIKLDSGAPTTVTVSDAARILRTESVKDLKSATSIQITDLSVGDRVLMLIHPTAEGSAPIATAVVAMKQSDIAQQQKAEQADWQRRGVGGIVKSVDASAGTLTIAVGARTVTVHATPKTIVRRYSPGSVKFSDAKPSTLEQIRVGDQLQARGDRSPDSTDLTADEVVTGSFRNIAGLIVSSDPAANTVTVNDLATRKPVVIHVTADSQLHKLPPTMAQMLAARFKSGGSGRGGSAPQAAPAAASSGNGQGPRQGGQRSSDLAQVLQHIPTIQISELHKGDAVMIVATQGAPDTVTAVTLLAGVEPILTASASQNMFSASWNLGGGNAEGEGTQ
jgi:preprotein translocase subunit YajC